MKNFVKWAVIIVLINVVTSIIGNIVGGGFDPNTAEQSMVAKILGWAGMLGGIACLFLGVKEKKDSDPSDFTFGRGWVEGFLITLVASVLVALWTFIYFSFIASDQIDIIHSVAMKNMAAQGMTPDKIEQAKSWMEFMFSPGGFAMWGFFAYLVIGMILSLIVAAIVNGMKKGGGEPAAAV